MYAYLCFINIMSILGLFADALESTTIHRLANSERIAKIFTHCLPDHDYVSVSHVIARPSANVTYQYHFVVFDHNCYP